MTAALVALAVSAAAPAATRTGSTSARIVKVLTITQTATLSFPKAVQTGSGAWGTVTIPAAAPSNPVYVDTQQAASAATSPAIFSVSGEPGQTYRITVPASVVSSPSSFTVNGFTIWSQTSGTVTSSRLAQVGASGTDTLRIGGTVTIAKGTKSQSYTAQVPVTVSYE